MLSGLITLASYQGGRLSFGRLWLGNTALEPTARDGADAGEGGGGDQLEYEWQ